MRRLSTEFQSTRPRGRTRPYVSFSYHTSLSFNPRVLAGGRDTRRKTSAKHYRFQSTRPRGRTRLLTKMRKRRPISFNPRVLAGGRDHWPHGIFTCSAVSIHASSREDATALWHRAYNLIWFQSTRPRGRTRPIASLGYEVCACFNPRVLAGGRDIFNVTHTCSFRCFNPRVLAGGRDRLSRLWIICFLFQSTRPRGRTRPLARISD